MHKISEALILEVFTLSLQAFLKKETREIIKGVNERNNCGRWAIYLEQVAHEKGLQEYIAYPEYNRRQNGEIKTILDGQSRVITINCDLILHTRGVNVAADNLIAIEVKKYDRPDEGKQLDRERLRALTKASYDGIWVNDGSSLPEHVCGYHLGVYVELDRKHHICCVEYYRNGEYKSESEYSF